MRARRESLEQVGESDAISDVFSSNPLATSQALGLNMVPSPLFFMVQTQRTLINF